MPLGSHEVLGRKDIIVLVSLGLWPQIGRRCCCKGLDAAPSERFTKFFASADRMLDAQGVGIIPTQREHFPTSEARTLLAKFGSGTTDQRLQHLIGLRPDNGSVSHDESRHASDSTLSAPLPISVNGILESSRLQDFPSFVAGKPKLFGNLHQYASAGNVRAVNKVGTKQSVLDSIASRLLYCPHSQLLREPAIVRHRPISVRQSLISHQLNHASLGRRYVDVAAGEESLQRETLRRRVRVQREVRELDVDLVGGTESFYTHGAEVTPRSDVVGEEFQDNWVRHVVICGLSDCPCAH